MDYFVICALVVLQFKTFYILAAARTKLNFQTAVLKARGQARGENIKYQQPESVLSETMVKAGQEIGDETPYGKHFLFSGNIT